MDLNTITSLFNTPPLKFARALQKTLEKYTASKLLPIFNNSTISKIEDMTTKLAYKAGFNNKELAERSYAKAMAARRRATLQIVPGPFSHRTNHSAFRPLVHLITEDAIYLPLRFSEIRDDIAKYLPYYMNKDKVRVAHHNKGDFIHTSAFYPGPETLQSIKSRYDAQDQFGNIYLMPMWEQLQMFRAGDPIKITLMPVVKPNYSSTINIYPYSLKYGNKYKGTYRSYVTPKGTKLHLIGHAATLQYKDGIPFAIPFPYFLEKGSYKNPRNGYTALYPLRHTAMHQGKALYSNYKDKEAPLRFSDYVNFLLKLPRNHKGFITLDYYGRDNDPVAAMQDDLVLTYNNYKNIYTAKDAKLLQDVTNTMTGRLTSAKRRRLAFLKRKHLLQKRKLRQRTLKRLQYLWLQASLHKNKNKHIAYI